MPSRFSSFVTEHLHRDLITLDEAMTCAQALEVIRLTGNANRISYYYTLDADGRLSGVVPVRQFLTSAPERLLSEMAIRHLVTLRSDLTLAEAAEVFRDHQFLALPVVRPDGTVAGVIDLKAVTGEEVDHSDKAVVAELFQTLGIRLEALATGSLGAVWRTRFPWLLSTLASGFLCAWLSSRFAATLEKTILLSFFIALVLALGESIAIQSMTFSFQELHKPPKERKRYPVLFGREVVMALALGLPIGVAVSVAAYLLDPRWIVSEVIGGAIALGVLNACLIGLMLPWVLKKFGVEPKVAGGPLVLALTDVSTVLVYLTLAAVAI